MVYKLEQWYGRLGNNIIQLYNLLSVALYNNTDVIIPPHKFLNKTLIKINNEIGSNEFEPNEKFFFKKNLIKNNGILPEVFDINKDKVECILRDLFIIKSDTETCLGDNDVVIHIRSGDIFKDGQKNTCHYTPAPLSYYTEILNNNNFEKIYIAAEDKKNPCIDKLLQLYPNIIFKQQKLEDDINLILRTKNIICSIGTFIPSLLMLSKNIKNVYMNDFDYNINTENYIKNINGNIIVFDYSEYYKRIGKFWWNTELHYYTMLNYKNE
jgi:hypothetical protein